MMTSDTTTLIGRFWRRSIVPALSDFIRIPNKSPAFDDDWQANGYMDEAAALIERWCRERTVGEHSVEVHRLPGRTPLILIELPGGTDETVLIYGHFDKQPEIGPWADGLDPWTPVLREGRLYGRGGADDGYAVFAAVAALNALDLAGTPRARCVILIEGCEESGSHDLPAYLEALKDRLGEPSLVVCLDAGCGNYDQLWLTTSLRGHIGGTLRVRVLEQAMHSGDAGGVVPSAFMLARRLLGRLEDAESGALIADLHVPIPEQRLAQARAFARAAGASRDGEPWASSVRPLAADPLERVLNKTWRPSLAVTGIDGMPAIADAGSSHLPALALKLSFRLPPTLGPSQAGALIKARLEASPPFDARVRFELSSCDGGWAAPAFEDWLLSSVGRASRRHFGRPAMYAGDGGTIPFLNLLGHAYPGVQYVVTGVLGPGSNAHGPNEFLDLDYARRLTGCVASVIADHALRSRGRVG